MSTVGKKALLVATWGLPLTWICVRYIPPRLEAGELCRRPIDCGYDQQGKYSFSSTSVIYDELRRGGWDVRVLVISQDTLVAGCQEGAGRQGSQGRAGPRGRVNAQVSAMRLGRGRLMMSTAAVIRSSSRRLRALDRWIT